MLGPKLPTYFPPTAEWTWFRSYKAYSSYFSRACTSINRKQQPSCYSCC